MKRRSVSSLTEGPSLDRGGASRSTTTAPVPLRGTGAATDRAEFSAGSLDVSAPGAGLAAAALDELLEPLGVGLHLVVVDADRSAGLLDQALGLPVDLDHHARLGVVQPVEG